MNDQSQGKSAIKKRIKPFLLFAAMMAPVLGVIYGCAWALEQGSQPLGLFGPAEEHRALDARSHPKKFMNKPVMTWVDNGRQLAFTFDDELYLVDAGGTEARRLSHPRTDDYFAYASAPSAAPGSGWMASRTGTPCDGC